MSKSSTTSQPTGVSTPGASPPTTGSVVQAIRTAFSGLPGMVSLDKAGRAKTPKMHKGDEALAPEVVKAAADFPGLVPGGIDPTIITTDLQRAADLETLRLELSQDLRKTEDTILALRGEAYQVMLVIYAAIQNQARLKPELANLVAKMASDMARAQGKGKGTKATAPKGKTAKAAKPAGTAVATPEPAPAPAASAQPAPAGPVTTVTTTTSTEPQK